MNRERAKELLPIIQAFADDKTIQLRGRYTDGWEDLRTSANFDDNDIEWRIKPEPRVFWINDYADGSIYIHKSQASSNSAQSINSKIEVIKVIEVLEDD